MLKQFKYVLRTELTARSGVLAVTVLVNLIFGVLGSNNVYGLGWKTAAVTFSSFCLVGVFIVSIICAVRSCKSLYSAPAGYINQLTPVPRQKMLTARIASIVLFDVIGYVLAISGVVWQAAIVDNSRFLAGFTLEFIRVKYTLIFILGLLIAYFFLISLLFLCYAIEKSLFCGIRLGVIPAGIVFVAAVYALSLTDFIMALFTAVTRKGIFFTIEIFPLNNVQMTVLYILYIVKCAAIIYATAKLTERRVNV